MARQKRLHYAGRVHYHEERPGFSSLTVNYYEWWALCGMPRRLSNSFPKGSKLPMCKHCLKAHRLGRNHAKGDPPATTSGTSRWIR